MRSASKGSRKCGGCHETNDLVVALVARCHVDSVQVLTKDSTVTGAQLCQHGSCLLGNVCSAVAMGGGRPLGSFEELLSMAVHNASWWMLLMADL